LNLTGTSLIIHLNERVCPMINGLLDAVVSNPRPACIRDMQWYGRAIPHCSSPAHRDPVLHLPDVQQRRLSSRSRSHGRDPKSGA
jgi:hypothetical protein